MRTTRIAVVLAAAYVMGAAPGIVRAAPGSAKTTWDGVFGAAQARTGEEIYGAKCVECHGPDGSGGNAPRLTGAQFAAEWEGVALSDLFERTKSSTPATNPGSLNRDEVAALMAYILELNGFPSGPADLPNAGELLKPIRFVSANPNTGR